MRERDIERYLVKKVKEAGGEIRKCLWIGRRGAPDRRVMIPGSKPCWVELKAPGKKPEPHQEREMRRMGELGEMTYIVDCMEGVDLLLKDIRISFANGLISNLLGELS